MQPEVSSKSQLFGSLKVYLNDKNRQQPIIGLQSIIECVKAGVQQKEPLYLCEVCVSHLRRADIRSHILGTNHRLNFIKTRYSHLVAKWEEKYERSEMAWQLMNVARNIESKEGPGDVQFLEVDDDVYQRMATLGENEVGAFIKSLRDGSTSLQRPIKIEKEEPQSPNQLIQCKTEPEPNIDPGEDSGFTDESVQKRETSWNKWTAQKYTQPSSFSSSAISEDGPSFLEDNAGTTTLHGLSRVVECQGQDVDMCFYLCHCCRIRANNEDIIKHLTSSSHLFNYLMEINPQKLNVDLKDNLPYLHLMVKRVEQQEGKGMLKIVTVPESISARLTGRNYHQCVKMLCKSLTHSYTHKKTTFPKVFRPAPYPAQQNKRTKEKTKKKTMKKKKKNLVDTVFRVNLPLTQGDLLLERTSFGTNKLPLLSDLAENEHQSSSQYLEEGDCDIGPFDSNYYDHNVLGDTSEPTQDYVDQNPSANKNLVTLVEYVETCGPVDPCFKQRGDGSGPVDHMQHEERTHNSWYASSRPTSENWQNDYDYQGQAGRSTQSVSHNQSWSMPDSSYRHGQYNMSSRREAETLAAMWPREERHCSRNTNSGQNNYNQYYQNYHTMPAENTANNAWRHGNVPNNMPPDLYSTTPNVQPCAGNAPASNMELSSYHRTHFETNHQHPQTYTNVGIEQVHSGPQGSWIQVFSYQDRKVEHGTRYDEMSQPGPSYYGDDDVPQLHNFAPPDVHVPGGPQYRHCVPYQNPYQGFSQF